MSNIWHLPEWLTIGQEQTSSCEALISTYHIHHCKGHRGNGDIWHNHAHFLDLALHPGCLYVWSQGVWACIDSANTQGAHSSIQHTADLWSICNTSRTIYSFFWPSPVQTYFLSAPNEDKGEHYSLNYQSTMNYLNVPSHRWLDNVHLKTFLHSSPIQIPYYLPPLYIFPRILKSTNDKLEVSKLGLKDWKSGSQQVSPVTTATRLTTHFRWLEYKLWS